MKYAALIELLPACGQINDFPIGLERVDESGKSFLGKPNRIKAPVNARTQKNQKSDATIYNPAQP